jgi:hypothetical protein
MNGVLFTTSPPAPPPPRCTCPEGYRGNGKVCYGNIMQRLRDLNTEPGGQWTGQLTEALTLFGTHHDTPRLTSDGLTRDMQHMCHASNGRVMRSLFLWSPFSGSVSWPLEKLGPFTVFVPINRAFRYSPVRRRAADTLLSIISLLFQIQLTI